MVDACVDVADNFHGDATEGWREGRFTKRYMQRLCLRVCIEGHGEDERYRDVAVCGMRIKGKRGGWG